MAIEGVAGRCTDWGVGGFTGRCHRPVVLSRFPIRATCSFLSVTVHDSALYTMVYPLSQNLLAAINKEWESPGIMCASVTLLGSHGMFRLQVCVEVSLLPSGMVMVRGATAGLMFIAGASVVKKCAVAPVSLMAWYVFSDSAGCGCVCIVLRALWFVAIRLVLDVVMVISSSSSSHSSLSARRAK